MAQPISANATSPMTREHLLKNFDRMVGWSKQGYSNSSSHYTHFVSNRASVKDPDNVSKVDYPIYECNCIDNMSRWSRYELVEEPLLKKVKEVFVDKTKPLTVFSLGSGGCYQELSWCIVLAREGYDVKQIVLADWKYKTNQPDYTVVAFSTFIKLLYPNAQIAVYGQQEEYFEEIKNSKQQKPDIILCIDIEPSDLVFRKSQYSYMLGSPSNEAIFAFHNPNGPGYDSGSTTTFVDKIQGFSKT